VDGAGGNRKVTSYLGGNLAFLKRYANRFEQAVSRFSGGGQEQDLRCPTRLLTLLNHQSEDLHYGRSLARSWTSRDEGDA
jgi:hypothetical protein